MKISQKVFFLQRGHKYGKKVFYLQRGHKNMVEMAMFNIQRAIIPKAGKTELLFMNSAGHGALSLCDVSSKYLKRFPTYSGH